VNSLGKFEFTMPAAKYKHSIHNWNLKQQNISTKFTTAFKTAKY
jgi:hypothetical protein